MDGRIIRLSVVDSTNIYTTKLAGQSDMREWTIVVADSQSAGKGQRGKKWDSEFGKNLLCSVYFQPRYLRVQEQFLISAAASVAVCQTLLEYGVEAGIKWPNDILIDGKKISGLLIENQLAGDFIDSTVVGIGLNVNQRSFSLYPWPATSLVNECEKREDLDLEELLWTLIGHLKNLTQLARSSKLSLLQAYNEALVFKGQIVDFESGNDRFSGTLKGVTLLGELVLQTPQGEASFVNGEIKLLRISH